MGKEAADTGKFLTDMEALSRIKVIALTGAIGSEQTTIAKYLEEHGASIAHQFAPHEEHRFMHVKVSEKAIRFRNRKDHLDNDELGLCP